MRCEFGNFIVNTENTHHEKINLYADRNAGFWFCISAGK
jgi:hypothetical protein